MAVLDTHAESRPGVLAFTLSLELLYMNQEAQDLIRQLACTKGSPVAHGLIPAEITRLCDEILRRLQARRDAKDWEQVHLRQMVGELPRPVLLQGFGIPDATGMDHSMIIVLMEERESRTDARVEAAKDRYHLTDREMHVLEHLARGLTNKEIAATLGIAEQTIKEHLKHIMEKTRVSTRTAVLAQLFHGEVTRLPKLMPKLMPQTGVKRTAQTSSVRKVAAVQGSRPR